MEEKFLSDNSCDIIGFNKIKIKKINFTEQDEKKIESEAELLFYLEMKKYWDTTIKIIRKYINTKIISVNGIDYTISFLKQNLNTKDLNKLKDCIENLKKMKDANLKYIILNKEDIEKVISIWEQILKENKKN